MSPMVPGFVCVVEGPRGGPAESGALKRARLYVAYAPVSLSRLQHRIDGCRFLGRPPPLPPMGSGSLRRAYSAQGGGAAVSLLKEQEAAPLLFPPVRRGPMSAHSRFIVRAIAALPGSRLLLPRPALSGEPAQDLRKLCDT